ncbi:hypothetical protein Cni_G13968 [Canna indica]|uniref:Uncharacterized protein n=1 Tax=Canna indica TaxID=4628 RepID=A0AAQ3QA94_9LILI|nr:hypothetical protein Cni_G13968 [Canna indica]
MATERSAGQQRIHIEIGKDHHIRYPKRPSDIKGGGSGRSFHASGESRLVEHASIAAPELLHLGWGQWYTLKKLEVHLGGKILFSIPPPSSIFFSPPLVFSPSPRNFSTVLPPSGG